jgi:hypothetical protein
MIKTPGFWRIIWTTWICGGSNVVSCTPIFSIFPFFHLVPVCHLSLPSLFLTLILTFCHRALDGDVDGSHGHAEDGMRWKHHSPMLHLLRFDCSKHGGILSSALSDDGKIVLYATRKGTRLFQLELPEDDISALDGMIAPSAVNISKFLPFLRKMIVLRALFIPGSHRVILLVDDGRVMHVDINLEDITSVEARSVITLESPLTSWSASCDGQWLAIAEANRQVQIWNMDTWKVCIH